jgi:hypothetical protein
MQSSLFHYVSGEPFMFDTSEETAQQTNKQNQKGTKQSKKKKSSSSSPSKNDNHPKKESDNDNGNQEQEQEEWAGDRIPPAELEKIRKRFKLTKEQMKIVMAKSKKNELVATKDATTSWTPHQQLNAVVYTILIGALIYVGNREYGNILTHWFIESFPREAEILGLI